MGIDILKDYTPSELAALDTLARVNEVPSDVELDKFVESLPKICDLVNTTGISTKAAVGLCFPNKKINQ